MNKKILIVDDDLAILEAISIALELENYKTKLLTNGDEVLSVSKDYKPDAILLDILLSGEDGRNIAKILKADEETCNIPIIIMSAHPTAKQTIKEIGVNDFIAKPFDLDKLLDTLKKHTT